MATTYFTLVHSRSGVDTTVAPGNIQLTSTVIRALSQNNYFLNLLKVDFVEAESGIVSFEAIGMVQLRYQPTSFITSGVQVVTPPAGVLLNGQFLDVDKYKPFEGCFQMRGGQDISLTFVYAALPIAASVSFRMSVTIGIEPKR